MIIDTNVYLSRYPFRRLAGDDPAALVARLRKRNAGQAWAGSFDALLHRDVAAVNARLAEDCRKSGEGLLLPFGAVNPKLPGWQEDLRRCHEAHHMRGIRLYPNYHGYKLDDPVFVELLSMAARRGLIVQVVHGVEDERTQHPLMQVPVVDLKPLADAARGASGIRLMVLSVNRLPLANAPGVTYDFAMLESPGIVAKLIAQVSPQGVVFGSHAPFYYFEAAALKVKEAGLPEDQQRAVLEENARRLLV